jgi:hypothetical protein
MVNGHGSDHNFTTWLSSNDPGTLTPAQVCADTLEPCLHDRPITFCAADFNLNGVQNDNTLIGETIQAKILKIGF